MQVAVTSVLLSALVVCAWAAEVDYPRYTYDDLGENVVLYCNSSDIPDGAVPTFWVTPQVKAMPPASVEANRAVSADGFEVVITSMTREDIGYWFCGLTTVNDTTYMQRIGLNINGPYFEDLWAKYQQNTIVGVSAGAGFAFLAIVLCLVHQFHWEKRMADRKIKDGVHDEEDIGSPVIELGPMPSKANGSSTQTEEQGQTNGTVVDEQQGQTNGAFVEEAPPAYNGRSEYQDVARL